MGEAARLLEGQGARIIDINMGCPARKVTSGASGAALMRDPDHALSLIEAVVAARRDGRHRQKPSRSSSQGREP